MYEFVILLIVILLASYRILAFPLWKGFKTPQEPVNKSIKKRTRVVTTVPKP